MRGGGSDYTGVGRPGLCPPSSLSGGLVGSGALSLGPIYLGRGGRPLYLPLFSSAEAAIAAYGQWFDGIIINLLAHPAPSRIIITDLVGFDSVFWEHTPGDTVMQDWVDQVVVGVRGEALPCPDCTLSPL